MNKTGCLDTKVVLGKGKTKKGWCDMNKEYIREWDGGNERVGMW